VRAALTRAAFWLLEYGSVAAAITFAEHPLGLLMRLAHVDPATQRTAFASTAGAMAIIAGFIVTTTFFFAAVDSSPSLTDFRREWGPRLSRVLLVAFGTVILSVALMVSAILAAPGMQAAYLAITACLLVLIQVARIAFLAWGMLQARYRDIFLIKTDYGDDAAATEHRDE
jgi:hypothetical protein